MKKKIVILPEYFEPIIASELLIDTLVLPLNSILSLMSSS